MTKKTGPKKTIKKPCTVCGALLKAGSRERQYCYRAFTCQSKTVVGDELPGVCYMRHAEDVEAMRIALIAMSTISSYGKGKGESHSGIRRAAVLADYIKEIGNGEPPIAWYREKIAQYSSVIVTGALARLPYWNNEELRLQSLSYIGPIDNCVARFRANANEHLADLLAGFIEHYYDLMQFGFDNGLYGDDNPVKLGTLSTKTYKIAHYLEWLFAQGHETLHHAGRSVMDEYIAYRGSHPGALYQISQFYDWVRKKHPFVPRINFNRKRKGVYRHAFPVLTRQESQEAYARICAHPDPTGRLLCLLALLYAQRAHDSVRLKISDLQKDPSSDLWLIARPGTEPFKVESETSRAITECIEIAQSKNRSLGPEETDYLLPGAIRNHMSEEWARERIKHVSGHGVHMLRRTAIPNMFRAGQKTMGTVVLRDVLNVSSPTIHHGIKMTGASINTPTAIKEADALRKAFLEDQDD
jgi:hypothetical protein